MIELKVGSGQRILELGCGETPHPQTHVRVDTRPIPGVTDFTADFEQPLPIADNDFEGLYCSYTLEHISYPKIPQFLAECHRIVKPGSKVVFTTPNTEAQLKWIWAHHDGWDDKDSFHACSELLFGSQNYEANSHKAYLTPGILTALFWTAGFEQVKVVPYGERQTDLCVTAVKPTTVLFHQPPRELTPCGIHEINVPGPIPEALFTHEAAYSGDIIKDATEPVKPLTKGSYAQSDCVPEPSTIVYHPEGSDKLVGMQLLRDQPAMSGSEGGAGSQGEGLTPALITPADPAPSPAELFDRAYFNGGGKVGGYAREGLWDYPVHNVTAAHVLARRPESVLELGCARAYIGKRIQDAGVRWTGLEVSKHCYLTRVADPVFQHDLCVTPWLFEVGAKHFDLCLSIATLEHVPEARVADVIQEMARVCRRGLHGIDFGSHDDGFDKTHCTLKLREWWVEQFAKHAPGWPVEILDKEELERGSLPPEVVTGDGKVKVNLGSFVTMFHHGWDNLDNHDLHQFATQYGYRFAACDIRQGLPYHTGTVDLLFMSHFLDQLTYAEGLTCLRECRRVLKPEGALRIVSTDATLLIGRYLGGCVGGPLELPLSNFAEISPEVAEASTDLRRLWALQMGGKAAAYDRETLHALLFEAGFLPYRASFRQTLADHLGCQQILRETLDLLPCLSLYVDALPSLER